MSDEQIAMLDEPKTAKPKRKWTRRQPAAEQAPTLNADQFQKLLAVLADTRSGAGMDMAALKEVLSQTAVGTAQAMQKAMKPENQDHPGVSCFSYPEGDKAKAKPVLPHPFFYNNYPFHMFPETQHYRELELAAMVEPGSYTVMRKDFTPMAVEVKGERDGDNKLTKVMVEFPVSREDKWKVPPQIVVLYQLVYNDVPRRRFVEAMNEYMAMFMGEAA